MPCGRTSETTRSSKSSSEVPTIRQSLTSPASERCSRPGSNLRRARSPVAPNKHDDVRLHRRHQRRHDVAGIGVGRYMLGHVPHTTTSVNHPTWVGDPAHVSAKLAG